MKVNVLVRVFCKKDGIINTHYIIIEKYMTLKELEDKLKKDKLGEILRIDFL